MKLLAQGNNAWVVEVPVHELVKIAEASTTSGQTPPALRVGLEIDVGALYMKLCELKGMHDRHLEIADDLKEMIKQLKTLDPFKYPPGQEPNNGRVLE